VHGCCKFAKSGRACGRRARQDIGDKGQDDRCRHRRSVSGSDGRGGVERPAARRHDPRLGEHRLAQHAVSVALDSQRELVGRSPAADPGIDIPGSPIVGRDCVFPIAVAPVHTGEIGTAQRTVLVQVEPVAAADIEGCRGADLHRSLRPARLRTPHAQIGAVGRFGAVDREGDTVEIGRGSRAEQLRFGDGRKPRAP